MNGDILFLAHRTPFPPDRGDSIRSWNILNALAQLAPVHLVTFGDASTDRAAMEAVCASVHLIGIQRSPPVAMAMAMLSGRAASVELFASAAFRAAVRDIGARHPIAAVYAFSGQMGQYADAFPPAARFLMDFTDVDSEKFAAYGRTKPGLAGFANRMEARRLRAFERSVARRADINVFVSKTEEQLFRRVMGEDRLATVTLENGVDLDRFCPGHAPLPGYEDGAPLIAFTGQMDYAPNIDAVAFFASEVLPLIRDRQADARFAIVGRAPTEAVHALARLPGVMVTGEVADTRPWLAAASTVVAPLRIARGIQNKVLEAMASGKAVVASPEAAEGIDACHGKEFLIAGTAAGQADAVLSLLHDRRKRMRMEQAARAAMEARYSWAAKLHLLPEIVFTGSARIAA